MSASAYTRIPLVAHQAVTGTLFGIAIIVVGIRTYVRTRIVKQFFLEDGLLLASSVILIATTGVCFASLVGMYDSIDIILIGASSTVLTEFIEHFTTEAKETNAMSVLWWLILFPIKVAYMSFFHKLTAQLRNLRIWWWCVSGFMILAMIACITASRFACSRTSFADIVEHCSGPSADQRVTHTVAVTTAFDVATDILIASFPILLLWNVQMEARQKFGLSIMLSLSLVMAVCAITRMAGIHLKGGIVDIVWLAFWQQEECSIAVIMFSMTAFRSFFVGGSIKPAKAHKGRTTYWRNKNLFRRFPRPLDEEDSHVLPVIPSATLTGMRTLIDGSGRIDSKSGSSIDREVLQV